MTTGRINQVATGPFQGACVSAAVAADVQTPGLSLGDTAATAGIGNARAFGQASARTTDRRPTSKALCRADSPRVPSRRSTELPG